MIIISLKQKYSWNSIQYNFHVFKKYIQNQLTNDHFSQNSIPCENSTIHSIYLYTGYIWLHQNQDDSVSISRNKGSVYVCSQHFSFFPMQL